MNHSAKESAKPMQPYYAIRKVSTGINGLDEVLNGGMPEGALTLLCGGPGSGKTMLGLEFLVRGACDGCPGILMTFEEKESALRNYASGFGWDIAHLEAQNRLALLNARIPPEAIISGDFDLQAILGILRQKTEAMHASRILIDAPDVFLRLLDNVSRERAELHQLNDWLRDSGMTALMTVKGETEHPFSVHYHFLEYMADCVVHLDQRVCDQVTTRRLRVVKYRGSAYCPNEYPFSISRDGIWIIPITRASLQHRAFGDPVSSGVPGLDNILSGGFRRNSCTLISGPSGTGKTTFACSFVQSTVKAGERLLYLDFEESWEALASCMRSPGIDLQTARDSGCLRFDSLMPESQGIEEHLVQAFRAIGEFHPRHIVVDAISACRRMGSKHAAFDYLLRLIDHCKQHGITTLLTNLTEATDPRDEITGIDLSSVIDTVIILRNVEHRGRYQRKLSILKSRGRSHSTSVHSFEITDQGIVILEGEQHHDHEP